MIIKRFNRIKRLIILDFSDVAGKLASKGFEEVYNFTDNQG
jgi:hypothetical protein